ncbi:hypothetical protein D3C76_557210 [compost metagenome]
MNKALAVLAIFALAACTTSQRIDRPDGSVEFHISCGAVTGWDICYSRAQKECPSGYTTILEDQGFNRKELRINCGQKR